MTVSKVKQIQGDGTWNSQHGLMYSFMVTMEDGTTLKANSKSQEPPYKVGDEVEYQVTKENQYGKQGKVKKFDANAPTKTYPVGGKNNDEIARLACIKAAAELHAQRSDSDDSKVIATAERFFQYAKNGTMLDGVKQTNEKDGEDSLPF